MNRQPAGRPGVPITVLSERDAMEHLEIHPAIAVGPPGTSPLPLYVRRDHDVELSGIVAEAATVSMMAVLVGDSSTGKSRACWEAIRRLPAEWFLWSPLYPTPAEALMRDLDQVRPRTVVWLDEIQLPLRNEQVATALRELLRATDRGPVLVLGTCWPKPWATLTARPAEDKPDPHPQARRLLDRRGIAVPSEFVTADLVKLHRLAAGDPRLELVDSRGTARVTQFLAGVPEVLRRYTEAADEIRAVATAAMDARRLGVVQNLPQSFLFEAAVGYLDDDSWNAVGGRSWFADALSYLGARCFGVPGPLTLVLPRPGQPAPAEPEYALADPLHEHGEQVRRHAVVPESSWMAAAKHVHAPDSLLGLARSAEDRTYYRLAARFASRAARAGSEEAVIFLARLAHRLDAPSPADEWFRLFADTTTNSSLTWELARAAAERGHNADADEWFLRTLELDPRAAADLLPILRDRDLVTRAADRLLPDAEAGRPDAMAAMIRLLEIAGRSAHETLFWHERAAATGDRYAVSAHIHALDAAGENLKAVELWREQAELGDVSAMKELGRRLLSDGDDEAGMWLERAVRSGGKRMVRTVTALLADAGNVDEAARLWRVHAESGNGQAVDRASQALIGLGRVDDAREVLLAGVDAGDSRSMISLADLYSGDGDRERALELLRAADAAGDELAGLRIGELLADRPDVSRAIEHWDRWARDGRPHAVPRLVRRLVTEGREAAAESLLANAVARDEAPALVFLGNRLAGQGRHDEAEQLFRRAAERDDFAGRRALSDHLEKTGRPGAAAQLWRAQALEGNHGALTRLVHLLTAAGEAGQVDPICRRATETGQLRSVLDWGDAADAQRRLRYGIEPGGRTADPWTFPALGDAD